MNDTISGAAALTEDMAGLDDEFALDLRVVEACDTAGNLLLSTSDNCGSTCSGTACTTSAGYPA